MPFSEQQCKEAHELLATHGSARKAQVVSGIHHSTLIRRAKAYKPETEPAYKLPDFPDNDIPVSELIESMKKRFNKRNEFQKAINWFPVRMRDDKPIGLAFVGDPHVDDDGCNWPLLEQDINIMKQDGIYGCNVGDTTNNWAGRLIRLFAKQETSQETAQKLAKWFLTDSGIKWLVWALGNHDSWGEGAAVLKAMNAHNVPMLDWQAKFEVKFPNKYGCRVWMAHDFPGNSMWNTMHGAQKAAHLKEQADIFICGHKHNWGLHQEESASKGYVYWLARARGYKHIDDYAEQGGHQSQSYGSTILAVINPKAPNASAAVQCFADLAAGADYLKYLRRNA